MVTASAAHDITASPIALLGRRDVAHPERALRTRELTSVTRGIYARTDEWLLLKPWERYLARVHGAAMRHPDAVFVLESAAALRGAAVIGEPAEVHVVASPATTSRPMGGVRVHTAQRMPQIEEIGGLLVAAPADVAVDIARSRHHAIGMAVASSILRQHPRLSVDELRLVNETRASSRGRRHARWALDRATGIPESTLECLSLVAIEWLGFPQPELQVWVRGASPEDDQRLDFWWPMSRIAGEADGDIKYEGMDAVAVFADRRDRDARLLTKGVSATVHWGWHDVTHVTPLRAALLAGGLRPESPEDTAQLRSLARLFRPLPAGGHRDFIRAPRLR
ncbi:hypothetical protein [Microbacterium timonense]|uniref:hypothetical protein n=1 Tax=Microbacterium timonense TaxID=2086576 RepID=UPI0011B259C7|nr:hypothetical protein [Microbacterium timonense]